MIKKIITAAGLIAAASASQAADLTVTLTNATHGIVFTPAVVAAHADTVTVFQSGTAASAALKAQAEEGMTGALKTMYDNAAANSAIAQAPLTGGNSVSFDLSTSDSNKYLSITSMLLPTNDAFVGLSNWKIPTTPGTYRINLNAYDAGTENNDELAASIPGPDGLTGTGGTGVVATGDENGVVHIHRGNLGDTNANGGVSDINSKTQRWLNPVARLTVVVK